MATGSSFLASLPKPLLAVILLSIGVTGSFLIYRGMSSPHQTAIPFQTIPTAGATGYSKQDYLVINDNDTWSNVWTKAFWDQSYCTQPPPLGGYPCEPAPFVNFTTRTVIAVFMGAQPGPLYTIEISQIVRSGPSTSVHVLWTDARNCGQAALETWPSYIVDVPKTEDHITFTTETVMHC